uniref:Uncharacterized protein n=1 Tax=Timema poppense TaxID=170557 RepID=A0A7R9HCF6_TIMPO|nr:unnamed protein product [Timema poppensis]
MTTNTVVINIENKEERDDVYKQSGSRAKGLCRTDFCFNRPYDGASGFSCRAPMWDERQIWTELKYKARSRETLLRAGRLETGNKPNNVPVLNDNEKKVIMIMGIKTAEGYCVADNLPEGQEDLERAIEGTAVPSVEDEPPRVFLEEILFLLLKMTLPKYFLRRFCSFC